MSTAKAAGLDFSIQGWDDRNLDQCGEQEAGGEEQELTIEEE